MVPRVARARLTTQGKIHNPPAGKTRSAARAMKRCPRCGPRPNGRAQQCPCPPGPGAGYELIEGHRCASTAGFVEPFNFAAVGARQPTSRARVLKVRIQSPPAKSRANGGHRCDGREQRSRSCERWNRSTCAPVIRAVPASAYRSSCRAAVQGAAAHRPDQAASRHGSAVGRVSASRNRTACQPLLRKTIAWYNSDVCLPPPISPWSGRSTEPRKICTPGR